jgi:hypothetical protein
MKRITMNCEVKEVRFNPALVRTGGRAVRTTIFSRRRNQ